MSVDGDSIGNGNSGNSGNGNAQRKAAKQGGLFGGFMRALRPGAANGSSLSGIGNGANGSASLHGAATSGDGRSGSGSGGGRHHKGSEPLTLYDAFGEFFGIEDLGGDNCYRCDRCKKLQRAHKRLRTLATPPLLCVHLKRFRFGFGATASGSCKASDKITFPVRGLTLDLFGAPPVVSGGGHDGPPASGAGYDLVSVVCHHGGSLTSGHYTAYVRAGGGGEAGDRSGCLGSGGSGQWYHVDDARVTPVHEATVLSCEAYVLFYERQQDAEHLLHRARTFDAIHRHRMRLSSDKVLIPLWTSFGSSAHAFCLLLPCHLLVAQPMCFVD